MSLSRNLPNITTRPTTPHCRRGEALNAVATVMPLTAVWSAAQYQDTQFDRGADQQCQQFRYRDTKTGWHGSVLVCVLNSALFGTDWSSCAGKNVGIQTS